MKTIEEFKGFSNESKTAYVRIYPNDVEVEIVISDDFLREVFTKKHMMIPKELVGDLADILQMVNRRIQREVFEEELPEEEDNEV